MAYLDANQQTTYHNALKQKIGPNHLDVFINILTLQLVAIQAKTVHETNTTAHQATTVCYGCISLWMQSVFF